MRKIFAITAIVFVTSSCNSDDVITEELENHYRAKTETSVAYQTKVFEYTPAPGQFINDTKTGGFTGNETTSEVASIYAEQRMKNGTFVSLGGFGGYIVVGFDHSIPNKSGYDLRIRSIAIDNSSEPGIVWVMQDSNGN